MFKRKNPAALASQLASLSGSKGFNSEDKGEWKLKLDNAGNGQAVIRFLPGKGDEGVPFAVLVNHGFKKGGNGILKTVLLPTVIMILAQYVNICPRMIHITPTMKNTSC